MIHSSLLCTQLSDQPSYENKRTSDWRMASTSKTKSLDPSVTPFAPQGPARSTETTGVTATVLAHPPALPSSQFTALMAAIQDSERRLDSKLADFKSDVKRAQEEATSKVIARAHQEKPFVYKKKSHDEQARFNHSVEVKIAEVQDALDEADESPAVLRAKQALEEGKRLLSGRQKLIKIADRSANGWSVVAEYTADELAADSDDEKRLEKAERAAEKKAGLKTKRRRLQQQGGGSWKFARSGPPYAAWSQPYLPQQPRPVLPAPPSGGPVRRMPPAQRPLGPCFACGELGHLRVSCPKTAMERKWYPSPKMCMSTGTHNSVSATSAKLQGNTTCIDQLCIPDNVRGDIDICSADISADIGMGRCCSCASTSSISSCNCVVDKGVGIQLAEAVEGVEISQRVWLRVGGPWLD